MGFIDFGAMELDGITGYAAADRVPVDTSGSFTLTAWAQAAAMPDGAVALASAEGSNQSAFAVRYVPDATDPEANPGRWQLTVADSDSTGATVAEVNNGEFYDARELEPSGPGLRRLRQGDPSLRQRRSGGGGLRRRRR